MSQPPPRPAVMDPTHMTEFASARYFEKLSQQRQEQLREEGHTAEASSVQQPSLPTLSQFILPLRESKVPDHAAVEPKQKKSRFGLSRFLHSKPQPAPAEPRDPSRIPTIVEPQDQKRLSVGESIKQRSIPFDELFRGLPTELQIQVIASLPLSDILNLRLASTAWHSMVTMNEAPIVRYHLDHHIPAYAKRLYPPPDTGRLDFHYLCGLWHRLHVAAKLSVYICEWVTKDLFLRTTEAQKLEFAPQKERMRRRLIPLLFTMFHFFETYRARHVQYLRDHDGRGLQHTPYTLNPIEVDIMSMYDNRTLLQVHQVFPLVVASFCRRLRPPSYVGRVERSLRGYIKERPADEVHVAALCIGGLRQVERFWEIRSYNSRVGAVDSWYKALTQETAEPVSKPRRGLMGLGRKKSSVAMREEEARSNGDSWLPRNGPMDWNPEQRNSLIFNTSLAAGMPMSPMSREDTDLLLSDLPILQKLWLTTAEALILEKKIVERPADIRRNAQVMLELIREDGLAEEDEGWYGQGAFDSVRPPMESIEEDPIEEAGPPS